MERNNGGDVFIDELRMELMYPRLWRRHKTNDRPTTSKTGHSRMQIAEYGFSTGQVSKQVINKALNDYLRVNDGVTIYSRRLVKQCNIYVRKKDRTGRDTNKTEAEDGPGNHDDLVIATGLAFIGYPDAALLSDDGLIPFRSDGPSTSNKSPIEVMADLAKVSQKADPSFLMPVTGVTELPKDDSIQAEVLRFAEQLGGIPIASEMPPTSIQKHTFGRR